MNVFFEEDGTFKVARVMEDIGTSMQIEAISGKRSKIKSATVLLKFESALDQLIPAADKIAAEIEYDFLYEVCADAEFGFAELAHDYFGHAPSAVEAAAIAIRLHSAPMYFYRRGKGRYQKAPAENLKAALASVERKKREAAEMAAWIDALKRGEMPEAMRPHIKQLLYKPDRNTLIAKACDAVVAELQQPLAQIFLRAGAWPQYAGNAVLAHMPAHDFHVGAFLAEYFPKGPEHASADALLSPMGLSHADVKAYSIDDAETTEIDDAFSLRDIDVDTVEVGIHIAAPALFFDALHSLENVARQRMSTVYYPGHKITMLPDAAIAAATLAEGRDCPCVSLYARVNRHTSEVISTRSAIETITIAKNLRLHELETWFTAEAIANNTPQGEFGDALIALYGIAIALKAKRGAKDGADFVDYNFAIRDHGADVAISARVRGSPIDTLVAEFMIFANSTWGELLAKNGVAGIYRAQQNMKTRMTTDALPHEGLGVAYYAWSSSPLRRYVDLINQRQLIALLQNATPRFPKRSPELAEIARTFDTTYDAYAEFQRNMERFWCLRYLAQREERQFAGTIIRDELVRGANLPLIVKLKTSPGLAAKNPVTVNIDSTDYWAIGGEFSLDQGLLDDKKDA